MIATALALQDTTKEAVHNEMTLAHAFELCQNRDTDLENFTRMLYEYSASLAALTTTLVINVCLTDKEKSDLIESINEMESMGKEIE
ncbi:hypothetical protein FJZ33_06420 [Candidatus Poribacteria bacterium]|nr:hypothetical protein [Candidatus Poribacteria bacterium]